MSFKGKFRPTHPEKYKGNPCEIYYRSGWELKFMKWLDCREDVIQWMSEERCVWYRDPVSKKNRRYYPDFIVQFRRRDGIMTTEMIEIKPKRQVKGPPSNPKRRTKSWLNEVATYATNTAKWKSATTYCEDRGWNFRIITEDELKV